MSKHLILDLINFDEKIKKLEQKKQKLLLGRVFAQRSRSSDALLTTEAHTKVQ